MENIGVMIFEHGYKTKKNRIRPQRKPNDKN